MLVGLHALDLLSHGSAMSIGLELYVEPLSLELLLVLLILHDVVEVTLKPIKSGIFEDRSHGVVLVVDNKEFTLVLARASTFEEH